MSIEIPGISKIAIDEPISNTGESDGEYPLKSDGILTREEAEARYAQYLKNDKLKLYPCKCGSKNCTGWMLFTKATAEVFIDMYSSEDEVDKHLVAQFFGGPMNGYNFEDDFIATHNQYYGGGPGEEG